MDAHLSTLQDFFSCVDALEFLMALGVDRSKIDLDEWKIRTVEKYVKGVKEARVYEIRFRVYFQRSLVERLLPFTSMKRPPL